MTLFPLKAPCIWKNAMPDLTHLFLMLIVAGTEYTKVTKVIEGEPQIIEREIKKVHLEG